MMKDLGDMRAIRFSERVRFLPWIGKQYCAGINGAKTLILGESQYRKDGKRFSRRMNIDLIAGQADGIGHYTAPWPYWTKIIKLLSPTDLAPHQFWHSVAYWNFIQRFTGLVARDRPTEKMWIEAVDPFLEVLARLRPDFVLVLGSQLWNRLPPALHMEGRDTESYKEYPTGTSHTAIAVMTNHPSSFGFSYTRWRPAVLRALKLAARRAKPGGATTPGPSRLTQRAPGR